MLARMTPLHPLHPRQETATPRAERVPQQAVLLAVARWCRNEYALCTASCRSYFIHHTWSGLRQQPCCAHGTEATARTGRSLIPSLARHIAHLCLDAPTDRLESAESLGLACPCYASGEPVAGDRRQREPSAGCVKPHTASATRNPARTVPEVGGNRACPHSNSAHSSFLHPDMAYAVCPVVLRHRIPQCPVW